MSVCICSRNTSKKYLLFSQYIFPLLANIIVITSAGHPVITEMYLPTDIIIIIFYKDVSFYFSGVCDGKPVDWMDSNEKEMALWQRMLDRPNFWVEGCLTLRPSLELASKN